MYAYSTRESGRRCKALPYLSRNQQMVMELSSNHRCMSSHGTCMSALGIYQCLGPSRSTLQHCLIRRSNTTYLPPPDHTQPLSYCPRVHHTNSYITWTVHTATPIHAKQLVIQDMLRRMAPAALSAPAQIQMKTGLRSRIWPRGGGSRTGSLNETIVGLLDERVQVHLS